MGSTSLTEELSSGAPALAGRVSSTRPQGSPGCDITEVRSNLHSNIHHMLLGLNIYPKYSPLLARGSLLELGWQGTGESRSQGPGPAKGDGTKAEACEDRELAKVTSQEGQAGGRPRTNRTSINKGRGPTRPQVKGLSSLSTPGNTELCNPGRVAASRNQLLFLCGTIQESPRTARTILG